jgi:hypothetical protein
VTGTLAPAQRTLGAHETLREVDKAIADTTALIENNSDDKEIRAAPPSQ